MLLAALALNLLLCACSSIRVDADYDPEASFTPLQTYSWFPDESGPGADPRTGDSLVSERVTSAVNRELKKMGYELVSPPADFSVGFSISVRRGIDVHSEPIYYGHYGRCSNSLGYGMGFGINTRVSEYEEGMLQIDIIDPLANKLLWRGTGTSRLRDNQTPEQKTKRIDEIVAKVLGQFPPEQER